MKCIICKRAETQPGVTTLTLERDGLIFVVKNIPAQVCPNCGEAYVDEAVTAQLFSTAERMSRSGALVDGREYIPA